MKLLNIELLHIQVSILVKPLPCDHSGGLVKHFDRPMYIPWIIILSLNQQLAPLVEGLVYDQASDAVDLFLPPPFAPF